MFGVGVADFDTYTPSRLVKLDESESVVGNRFSWTSDFPPGGSGFGLGVVDTCR